MDPRLVRLYTEELAHVREMGEEFAREFPKIAARLSMNGLEVADPYVERLLEGFAFVAARVRLKLEAEYPRFTQQLLQIVFPQYLSPTPSFAIVELALRPGDGSASGGLALPKDTAIRASATRGETTACEFRTAHPITLWPIRIESARVFTAAPDLPLGRLQTPRPARGGVRLRLACTGDKTLADLDCDELVFHVKAPENVAYRLFEQVVGHGLGALLVDKRANILDQLPAASIEAIGYDDDEALLPTDARTFSGYRLLREYFAFPQRFLFFRVRGLRNAFRRCASEGCELVFLASSVDQALEAMVDADSFSLHATPIVNLFRKRADRVPIHEGTFEHQVVVDRARPQDFEVFSVERVQGLVVEKKESTEFLPFYAGFDAHGRTGHTAFFTVRREPTNRSERQMRSGTRAGYLGSEVFVSLVDTREAPYPVDVEQLAIEVLATHRDLPQLLPMGDLARLHCDSFTAIESIRLLAGFTKPQPAIEEGDHPWRLISHLGLNYLSLFDTPGGTSAGALQELLRLYCQPDDRAAQRQIESIRRLATRPIVRRLPIAGPICFGRGLEITCEVDESGFAGGSAFLFASVLERFFAQHVALNTFTQTILRSENRGEVRRWPSRSGNRIVA